MNILLCPMGSLGDILPFLGLGQALQARGHRVVVLTFASFADEVRQAGLELRTTMTAADYEAAVLRANAKIVAGLGEEMFRTATRPWFSARGTGPLPVASGPPAPPQGSPQSPPSASLSGPESADLKEFLEQLRQLYRLIVELRQAFRGQLLLVASSAAWAARCAHEQLGIPLVTVDTAVQGLLALLEQQELATSNRPGAAQQVDNTQEAQIANWFRAELGLPRIRGSFLKWIFSPQRALAFYPPWFVPPRPSPLPQLRLTSFSLYYPQADAELAADVAGFLARGAPPVVFSCASWVRGRQEFFEVAVEASRQLGCRALLLSPELAQVPAALSSEILCAEFVPFKRLLPRAAALVHNVGLGTTGQGLAAGIPQLGVPLLPDQEYNVAQLERLEVGRRLSPTEFQVPAVVAALQALLASPRVQERCRALARRLQGTDPIQECCQLIEETTRTAKPPA